MALGVEKLEKPGVEPPKVGGGGELESDAGILVDVGVSESESRSKGAGKSDKCLDTFTSSKAGSLDKALARDNNGRRRLYPLLTDMS